MPTLFDVFGFPLDDRSEPVEAIRKTRQCPFMNDICDGGGNRYQTEIPLTPTEPLTNYFNPGIKRVVPGVCSILAGEDIWVVCPRRLLAARHLGEGLPAINQSLQPYERALLIAIGLPQGIKIGLWAEVVLKQRLDEADINYHFDYIAAPLVETTLEKALLQLRLAPEQLSIELKNMLTIARKNGYYPKGVSNAANVPMLLPDMTTPYILEVMTASTSGSDTENETDMRNAFRNALLYNSHISPGVNKRQVWGRMVTQLFAKTALSKQWGGRTIWIIQDELLRNIELTTRLRTRSIANNEAHNISLVVMHYEVAPNDGKRRMSYKATIQGDAGIDFGGNHSFTDILLPKTAPPKIELLRAILRRKLGAIVVL